MPIPAATRLGPYEIVAPIGAGGMGEVYRARDTRLDRTVAVKVLPSHVASHPDVRQRFEREARTISSLNHPHICTLYDVGELDRPGTDAMRYLVMEFVEGDTLRQRLRRPPAPTVDEVIDAAIQMAGALGAAHAAGVVHRDLKPENVIVRRDGCVKVLDFGVSKLVGPAAPVDAATMAGARTELGMVVGTTKYMSPEQARGLPVDGRSDLFSLGVLIYEMLCGRTPFEAPTGTDTLVAILERPPAPLARLRADVPADLQRLVLRCLEKDPSGRYQSADEMGADLKRLRADTASRQAAPGAPSSIAVLPFVNMSADPENEYFCDGLAEELISALSRIDPLRVAARSSAFSFKGKQADVREVGRALNVATVLEGSVRKAGGRLRITAQLVNVADGYHIWSERYDRQLEDVFAIQDEISLAIVDALKIRLLGEQKSELLKRHTVNVEAYQLYLKARHHWHKWNEEGFARAKEYAEQAIRIDPDYALAYFALADVYLARGATGWPVAEILPPAKAALEKALALDEGLAEAWTLRGVCHMYEYEWVACEDVLMRAIGLNPKLGHAYLVLGLVCQYLGRHEEALIAARRAVELDPLVPFWNYGLARAHRVRGEFDAGLARVQSLLDIDPTFWFGHMEKGIMLFATGSPREAIEAFERAVRCSGGAPHAVGRLACALALTGERDGARRELDGLLARARTQYVAPASIACAYFGLGEIDAAFEWLSRALACHDLDLLLNQHDPMLAPLERDPRMAEIRRAMRLPA